MKNRSPVKYILWGVIVALVILHQDNWLWNNTTLVFGFMPATLLYHASLSVAASVTWYLMTVFAWPADLERTASGRDRGGDP